MIGTHIARAKATQKNTPAESDKNWSVTWHINNELRFVQ
jgi:hypothetical protein